MQFFIALDQLCNALLGGFADETLSARIWRNHIRSSRWLALMILVDTLFFWEANHCLRSYQSEMLRKHLPISYRKGI